MRRFLHQPLPEEGDVVLGEDTSHHLLHVARLPRGSVFGLFDGQGREARAELVDARDGRVLARLCSPVVEATPEHQVHLVLAILKGDAMAHALRMATEAGATHIWPVRTQRTIPKGDRHERWLRILHSAAQQSGRADVPVLAPMASLAHAVDDLPDLPRYVAAPGAEPRASAAEDAVVAVGPEGGWTPAELQLFRDRGWQSIGLGRWVLRADTAAAVAVATLAR